MGHRSQSFIVAFVELSSRLLTKLLKSDKTDAMADTSAEKELRYVLRLYAPKFNHINQHSTLSEQRLTLHARIKTDLQSFHRKQHRARKDLEQRYLRKRQPMQKRQNGDRTDLRDQQDAECKLLQEKL